MGRKPWTSAKFSPCMRCGNLLYLGVVISRRPCVDTLLVCWALIYAETAHG